MVSKVRKAIIPAAGLGTRFYPLTRAQPKEMLPVLDKPVIHYVVEEALASGLDEVLIIVGKGKEAIINYFDKSDLDKKFKNEFDAFPEIFFVRQKELLGLADSVKYARKFVGDEPFAVLLGDTIYRTIEKKTVTQQILDVFGRKRGQVIAVERVRREKIKDYGIVSGIEEEKGVWRVKDLVEKPEPEEAPSDLGITGTYIFTPEIFEYIDGISPGKNGEYQLTDALKSMCKKKDVFAASFSGTRYDIGTKELWIKTFVEFARDDNRFKDLV